MNTNLHCRLGNTGLRYHIPTGLVFDESSKKCFGCDTVPEPFAFLGYELVATPDINVDELLVPLELKSSSWNHALVVNSYDDSTRR